MNSGPKPISQHIGKRSLRDQVDELLPGWQSWYPSLFDAAQDLGILRARVCDLSSLVLSNRHASIYNEAVQAFRNQWSVEEPEQHDVTDRGSRRAQRNIAHTHDAHKDEDTDAAGSAAPFTQDIPDDLL